MRDRKPLSQEHKRSGLVERASLKPIIIDTAGEPRAIKRYLITPRCFRLIDQYGDLPAQQIIMTISLVLLTPGPWPLTPPTVYLIRVDGLNGFG